MTDSLLYKNEYGLQIQPQYAFRDEWQALAEREKLQFEVLDLSMQPALTDDEQYRLYRDWYRESRLAVSLHGVFMDINPGRGDPAFRELSFRRCKKSCETALEIGAENIVFHSSYMPFLGGSYTEVWAEKCASFFEELAEKYSLRIYIENSQDISPGPLRMLMDRISNPRIGVCLDLGHVNYTPVPPEMWFDTLGDRIGYIHLSDNNSAYDEHLPLGEGTVDWEKVDGLWKQLNRKVPLTLEVGGPDGVRKSIAFLKEHGYFGIRRT
jgi:sugar phosphate isomerase/epimerase